MEKFAIASLAYKSTGGNKSQDQDIRVDSIVAFATIDANTIGVKMVNGYSFTVPAKVGLELNKLWQQAAIGELDPGIHNIPKND